MAPSSSRNGARVIWVTVHTAEGIRKASGLVAYFNGGVAASSHAVADDTTLIDNLVPYDRAAWTLRNGNPKSDNLELCGFAAWSREEWLTNHQGMLNFAAQWVRARCLARGIPIVKLTPAQVGAGQSGVIGHVDYTRGTGDGTHTDPGPGFPWDVVIAKASAGTSQLTGGFLMALSESDQQALIWRVEALVKGRSTVAGGPTKGEPVVQSVDAQASNWRVEALTHSRDAVTGGPAKGEKVDLVAELKALKAAVAELSKKLG